VINSSLHPNLHRFQVIADYWWNLRFRQGIAALFNTLVQYAPLNSGPRYLA